MTQKILPHSEDELIIQFEQAGCASQFFQMFKDKYYKTFSELCEDGIALCDEDVEYLIESKNDSLTFTLEKIKFFMQEINNGHSEQWASLLLSNVPISDYDDEDYYGANIYDTYYKLLLTDSRLANREIEIHSKQFGEDEHFERCFVTIFTDGILTENPIKYARIYSQSYKQLLKEGKSEIYAHFYAEKFAYCELVDEYCEQYAYAMERAISQGLEEWQAFDMADDFASEVVNGYLRSHAYKHYEFLQENTKYLSKNIDDAPNEISKDHLQYYIHSLPEKKLADFLLDSIIIHRKNEKNA